MLFVSPQNKSVCKIIKVRQVVNPVYESVIGNHSKRAGKQSFNVSSQKHGVTKSLNLKNILMTSLYTYELAIFFFIFHQNFSNDFFKRYATRNNLSRNTFLNSDSFIYHDFHNVNISHHADVLST